MKNNMAIYLDYEDIKGTVTAEGYEGMISLKYFRFNVSRKINMEPGGMANRENSLPTFSTVYIEKFSDISTPALFNVSVAGNKGKRAILHFMRTGTDKSIEYMTYTLENCLISRYLIFHTDLTKAPHEQIELSYTSILMSDTGRNANNQAVDTFRHGYDLSKAKNL